MTRLILVFVLQFPAIVGLAQNDSLIQNDTMDYYFQIPDYPATYTAGNVVARVVDGLGFRYYWVTQGLRPEDLSFRPNEEARTSNQTLDHIYTLTRIVYNAVSGNSNELNESSKDWSFEIKRAKTLENIKLTSELLKASSDDDFKNFITKFQRENGVTEYPFWNMLNGPIDDALWHVGQVVSFRRSSGNPLNSNVSMLQGRLRN